MQKRELHPRCMRFMGARHFFAFFLWFNAAGLLTLPGC